MSKEEKTCFWPNTVAIDFSLRTRVVFVKRIQSSTNRTLLSHWYNTLLSVPKIPHDFSSFRGRGQWREHDSSCWHWDWHIWTGRHAGAVPINCSGLSLALLILVGVRAFFAVSGELLPKSFAELSSDRRLLSQTFITSSLLPGLSEHRDQRMLSFLQTAGDICVLQPDSTHPFREVLPPETNVFP